MAYTTIKNSSDYFNTKTWSGNNTDPTTISGLNFQPDMIWGKARSGTYSTQDHCINDAVRGANNILRVNQTNAEETDDNNIKSFTSDGWTMGNDGKINQASTEYVGWSWKANGAGSSNTDGSITSTVSANTTSGFSIVSYTGTGANATVGHGLDATPKVVIVKNRTDATNWHVYHGAINGMSGGYITLNNNDGFLTNVTDIWNGNHSSTIVDLGSNNNSNGSSDNMIAYCFAEKKGFSKFGSYTGNGNNDGTFIYTGFKPAWFMVKQTNAAGNEWFISDSTRSPFNVGSKQIAASGSGAEESGQSYNQFDIVSNGYKIRGNDTRNNGSGSTYIYMAFAEEPLVGDNPATAR